MGNLKLRVQSSGQYLNILNGGSVNGTLACQGVLANPNNAPSNFCWELVASPTNPGWFLFKVQSSGQYLNILNGGNINGTSACQGVLNDISAAPDNFLWQYEPAPNNPGWYRIKVKSSGQYLNIFNGGGVNGTRACQGNIPTTTNFFWQQIHTISVSATIARPHPLTISDDQGHLAETDPADAALTTQVYPGDTVIWQKGGDIQSLDNVAEKAGVDLFSTDPTLQPDGTWQGVIGSLPTGSEELYNIEYTVDGVAQSQDPRLKMN